LEYHEDNYEKVRPRTSPRKNVLVLSCMDLRLLDNLVAFMDFENLDNRYDQFILAGAAAGANSGGPWRLAFFDHLCLAVALHEIKYVYIVEHRDCGAYEVMFGEDGSFARYNPEASRYEIDRLGETHLHRDQAQQLKLEIDAFCAARRKDPFPGPEIPSHAAFRGIIGKKYAGKDIDSAAFRAYLAKHWQIEVRGFLMGLRGEIEPLDLEAPTGSTGGHVGPEVGDGGGAAPKRASRSRRRA
jgi:hypothetical protein